MLNIIKLLNELEISRFNYNGILTKPGQTFIEFEYNRKRYIHYVDGSAYRLEISYVHQTHDDHNICFDFDDESELLAAIKSLLPSV